MGLPAKPGQLPPRKRKFVEEYARRGDEHAAYLAAGYKESNLSKRKARAMARELSKEISEAVSAFASSNEMAVLGLKTLRELAMESESDAVRLNAAKEILTRTLPEAPKEVNFNHRVTNMTDAELMSRLRELQMEFVVSEQ